MSKIKECVRVGSEVVVKYKEKDPVTCNAIRGAISWPLINYPGYYLIMGRRTYVNSNMKAPLILLFEGEADLLDDLCNQLYQDARKCFCFQFYADFDEANYEHYNIFIRFMERLNMSRIELLPSEISDWNAGILEIKKWARDDALQGVKDSILGGQLGRITKSDDQDSKKSEFYAVGALKNVIRGFDVQPSFGRRITASDYVY